MKNILVVSDNADLVTHFRGLVSRREISYAAGFDFTYSAKNKNPFLLEKMGLQSIDLADDDVCSYVIKKYDFVLSIHCKQIFPARLVSEVVCINFHPGYNPYNRGWYPQVFSILWKMPIGVTIHLMDEHVDHGPIISREEVKIYPWDTSLDVYDRVIEKEKELMDSSLESIVNNGYSLLSPDSSGNYNSIGDFQRLCRLDLEAEGTLQEHLDRLRALSHGDYRNAYFEYDGRMTYVALQLSRVGDDSRSCFDRERLVDGVLDLTQIGSLGSCLETLGWRKDSWKRPYFSARDHSMVVQLRVFS